MTCLCGVARSFPALFLARIGVGVGEAALSPPAYSLLSDYFRREALPRAMAIYTLGITIGGGLAYMIGGAVYGYFTEHGALDLPLVGTLEPWQTTFVIVGLPGFLLVVLLMFMSEPPRSQKNDPNDAAAVAVCALRSDLTRVVTIRSAGHKAMRLLVKRHRDQAQLRATHCSRLHSLLAELEPGGIAGTITVTKANRLLNGLKPETDVERNAVLIATEIIDDIVELDRDLVASKRRVETAVKASGTCLCDIVGVGPIVAGTIIGYTPDIARFATRGSFAAYNGTAPIEVSSGGRTRHRLNLRGNRQLNFAIHIAAVVQVRTGGEGRAYYDRKIAEGKTNKEAIRALKRRISDRVWTCLRTDTAQTPGY